MKLFFTIAAVAAASSMASASTVYDVASTILGDECVGPVGLVDFGQPGSEICTDECAQYIETVGQTVNQTCGTVSDYEAYAKKTFGDAPYLLVEYFPPRSSCSTAMTSAIAVKLDGTCYTSFAYSDDYNPARIPSDGRINSVVATMQDPTWRFSTTVTLATYEDQACKTPISYYTLYDIMYDGAKCQNSVLKVKLINAPNPAAPKPSPTTLAPLPSVSSVSSVPTPSSSAKVSMLTASATALLTVVLAALL